MWDLAFEVIRSIFLLIASILIIVTAYGILKLDDDKDKVLYARIHLLGMFDIAGVLALIGLNQIFLAGVYLIIAPFIAHAIANAYYHGEDEKRIIKNIDEFNTPSQNKTNDKFNTQNSLDKDSDKFNTLNEKKTNDELMEGNT